MYQDSEIRLAIARELIDAAGNWLQQPESPGYMITVREIIKATLEISDALISGTAAPALVPVPPAEEPTEPTA